MEFALLLKQFFVLLPGLHLWREALGYEETVALRYVCRARDALLLELEFGREVYEFRFQAPHAVLHGVELEAIDVFLFGELFVQALAAPPELRHGCSLRFWGLAGTPF